MKIKHKSLKTNTHKVVCSLLFGATAVVSTQGIAASPLWTVTATTPTMLTIPAGSSTTVNYTITNKSKKTHTLMMRPIAGVTQVTSGTGICGSAAILATNQSCTLQLTISSTAGTLNGGPQICQQGPDGQPSPLQCYQPIASQSLQISTVPMVSLGNSFGGGKVACLDSAPNQLLIAANADNSTSIAWDTSSSPLAIGPSAQSVTDGATNTQAIVNALGANGAAAKLCADYAVNAQGNPCQSGDTCYSDWFLPAQDQLSCLYINRMDIDGFANAFYWSSTEYSDNPAAKAWDRDFSNGNQFTGDKGVEMRVRCVRALTP